MDVTVLLYNALVATKNRTELVRIANLGAEAMETHCRSWAYCPWEVVPLAETLVYRVLDGVDWHALVTQVLAA